MLTSATTTTKPSAMVTAAAQAATGALRAAHRRVRLTRDALTFVWSLFVALPLILLDAAYQRLTNDVPYGVEDLLDPATFSRLTVHKRKAVKVAFATQTKQLAHCTDRAWLRVTYEGNDHETLVFAKTHTKPFGLRVLLNAMDVYRNEIEAYGSIDLRAAAGVNVPGVHIAKWSRSRFVLVLDDLGSEGAKFLSVWGTTVDRALAQSVLTTLAKLHVGFWGPQNVPQSVWRPGNRPYLSSALTMSCLRKATAKFDETLFPADAREIMTALAERMPEFRATLDKASPRVMIHGDAHIGNFYIQPNAAESVGIVDLQCLALEHPMRDVAYFLTMSKTDNFTAEDEIDLVRFYLAKLAEFGAPADEIPTLEEALEAYRLQAAFTLYAMTLASSFSDLVDEAMLRESLPRVCSVVKRWDVKGALQRAGVIP